ncbi:myelin basic protein-like isoform X2 [Hypomesus transpacificus]|uniref:myelin basic protein-like isoform X2 n=1 Tax=Hypomesus transpacificus TaxID=137520 RepID=UPI001F07F05C|nr:myelin basic protein-like isoform X2 [Hypomesus transpacificus]
MATASTSGQSRKKKSPGLLDQIGTFFGGEKKKARSKGSFRGHLSTAPPRPAASARRHGADNAVMQFLRSFVSTPQPKSRWREILGLTESLLLDDYLDDFEIARPFLNRLRLLCRIKNKAHNNVVLCSCMSFESFEIVVSSCMPHSMSRLL